MALAEGKPAPDFALPDEGGATLRLSDVRGRPAVVAADGTVKRIFPKVKVDGHVREVLAAL